MGMAGSVQRGARTVEEEQDSLTPSVLSSQSLTPSVLSSQFLLKITLRTSGDEAVSLHSALAAAQ
ncbi:hypothetical protein PGTUg99_025929 [Puccinia graminis f. sp. tritici]|uniref:Uncharacterized protein n=1 Tax=Puccinia graminis f. sp. tritici TaxID=56615 RepID=A0A5B0RWT8_PUCGR|nr:hypothetical protein PGTUg99_025929 [Puccinia graminis f. sp. tritici]